MWPHGKDGGPALGFHTGLKVMQLPLTSVYPNGAGWQRKENLPRAIHSQSMPLWMWHSGDLVIHLGFRDIFKRPGLSIPPHVERDLTAQKSILK